MGVGKIKPLKMGNFSPLLTEDDVSDLDIEGWMKNFKTEALLTP